MPVDGVSVVLVHGARADWSACATTIESAATLARDEGKTVADAFTRDFLPR
jgi:hypothetical protein